MAVSAWGCLALAQTSAAVPAADDPSVERSALLAERQTARRLFHDQAMALVDPSSPNATPADTVPPSARPRSVATANPLRQSMMQWLLPYATQRRTLLLPQQVPQGAGANSQSAPLHAIQQSPIGAAFAKLQQAHAERISASLEACQAHPDLGVEIALEALREWPQAELPRQYLRKHLPHYSLERRIARPQAGTSREAELGWPAGKYWRIKSPHFLVLTNSAPSQGTDLAELLEQLYAAAQPILFAPPQTLPRHTRRSPLRVVLFADREQYVTFLQPTIPQIQATVGYYDPARRTCYFSLDQQGLHRDTIFHEATHQILHDRWAPDHPVGEEKNFWMVEGIALYMESCLLGEHAVGVGGADAARLQFARYRALREPSIVSFEQMCQFGRTSFQQHPDLPKLYTQAAGWTHFMMDAEQGAHRAAFLQFLAQIYQSERLPQAPWQGSPATRVEDWEAAYQKFLTLDPQTLDQLLPRTATQLCLGQTKLGPGVAQVAEYHELEWLDVAGLAVDDRWINTLGPQTRLRQLNLERTQVTPAALPQVGQWTQLEELDLSHIPLLDADLAPLLQLHQLKVLWLTGTQVSDLCLPQLERLSSLQSLDLRGTRITPAGVTRLRQKLPQTEITVN